MAFVPSNRLTPFFHWCLWRTSKTGLAVGLMVTASHNAEPDNGIKMVDPNGGMLSQDWEKYAEVCVIIDSNSANI